MQCDILITNDDGIHAPGLAELKSALASLGQVLVVAPDSERSAMGHGITLVNPLRVFEIQKDGELYGLAVNGTPADCVKLAVHNLLATKPRLVVSGINPGPNLGTNVLYSGTVSAATEGRILGIPSLAVSLRAYQAENGFSVAGFYARKIAEYILRHGLPEGVLLNLNVPALAQDEIKGIRLTHLAQYEYQDWYDCRQDPGGRDYYCLTGQEPKILNPGSHTDANAIEEGYVSLTPLAYDLTCRSYLPVLQAWF